MTPWTIDQQREWILNKMDEDIRNLQAIAEGTHNFARDLTGPGAVRRTERLSTLITVAERFGLMSGEVLVEWLNERAGSELLRDVPAYNRLADS